MSACSAQEEEVIEIQNKNFSGLLLIQKVENNSSSDKLSKIINDKQKIEKVLSMVEGLEVRKTDTDYMMDELKSNNAYSFSFAEGDEMETPKQSPYSFVVLNDGTFFFTHKEVNSIQQPRITIVKHEELLNEMKQLLDVDF